MLSKLPKPRRTYPRPRLGKRVGRNCPLLLTCPVSPDLGRSSCSWLAAGFAPEAAESQTVRRTREASLHWPGERGSAWEQRLPPSACAGPPQMKPVSQAVS